MPKTEARKRARKERLREVLEVLLEELDEASRAFQSAWKKAKENLEDEEAWGELQVWVSVMGVKAKSLEELLEEEAFLTS
jgi:restriction endonuclease S subunit